MFLAKLDPGGKCLWNKAFGPYGGDVPLGFVIDGDQPVVVGLSASDFELGGACPFHIQGDGFIARFDSNGECLWSKVLSPGLSIQQVEPFGASHFVALGYFNDQIDLGGPCQLGFPGDNDFALAKFDTASGACVWIKRIDVPSALNLDARYVDMVADGTGDLLIAGSFPGSIAFEGCQMLEASSVMGREIFAAKLNGDGVCLWSRVYLTESSPNVTGVALSAAGNLLVAGEFFGSLSFGSGLDLSTSALSVYVAELSVGLGTPLWARQFGDTIQLYSYDMAVDPAGNIAITGSMQEDTDFGGGVLKSSGEGDIFLLKLDAKGDYLASARYGTEGNDLGKAIISLDACGALLYGGISGNTDVGCGITLESNGSYSFISRVPLGP